jgi:hypothetical protein
MLKHTLDKSYYYEIIDKLDDMGFSSEYVLNAFTQAMSGDDLEELLRFFIRVHDLEEELDNDDN